MFIVEPQVRMEDSCEAHPRGLGGKDVDSQDIGVVRFIGDACRADGIDVMG